MNTAAGLLVSAGLIVVSVAIIGGGAWLATEFGPEPARSRLASAVPTPKPRPSGCGTAEAVLLKLGASPRNGWREVQFLSRDWSAIPFDTKKYLVTQIAECLAPSPSTTVRDSMTGKELATYSPLWGVKINN